MILSISSGTPCFNMRAWHVHCLSIVCRCSDLVLLKQELDRHFAPRAAHAPSQHPTTVLGMGASPAADQMVLVDEMHDELSMPWPTA